MAYIVETVIVLLCYRIKIKIKLLISKTSCLKEILVRAFIRKLLFGNQDDVIECGVLYILFFAVAMVI